MQISKERILGVLATLLSALTFGTFAIWIEFAYRYLEPWHLLSVQSLISSGLLLLINLPKGKDAFTLPFPILRDLVFLGLVGSMLAATCFTWAVKFLAPALVTILFYSYPAMVIIGSYLWLRTPINWYHWAAVALTFIGAFLSVGPIEGDLSLIGMALALGAALCTAFYNLQGEKVLSSVAPLKAMTISQFASTVGLLFLAPPTYFFSGGLPWEGVLIAFGTSVVASLIPFFLLLKGISLIGAGPASIVSTMELPTVAVLSFLVFGYRLYLLQLIGLVLVLAAIFLIHMGSGNLQTKSS